GKPVSDKVICLSKIQTQRRQDLLKERARVTAWDTECLALIQTEGLCLLRFPEKIAESSSRARISEGAVAVRFDLPGIVHHLGISRRAKPSVPKLKPCPDLKRLFRIEVDDRLAYADQWSATRGSYLFEGGAFAIATLGANRSHYPSAIWPGC